ncbi:hypothetical protein DYBT9623_03129 [Dyadobacter sp. CECT 9623]|jgi:hypothetical protein|uniref:Secretion system C-terminal sorting domain-containing protein n=1 Tax=Dyadobacter linearis TaxID=2823330 RepID=A0ABM8USA2_9BACT|nr:T9SS type A sorting domain-containing protein [Dyadobacter sp. CECT 9623]CAG5070583.1 hypothetical protein DYBT9623_03129 [Dyadobacter sp. CECT 9623]
MKKLLLILLVVFAFAGCKKPEVDTDLLLVAYPNPATSQISVYLINDQQQACIIRIFDPNAKQIAELKVDAGTSTSGIKFDLEGQDRGTYQVVVEIGGITLIEKFYKV